MVRQEMALSSVSYTVAVSKVLYPTRWREHLLSPFIANPSNLKEAIMRFGLSTLPSNERVRRGVLREQHIAEALGRHGFQIIDATGDEDKGRQKIDRWLVVNGQKKGMQIKFRETGSDILFEVFDTFHDWDHPHNKVGRDMIGDAEVYACLIDGVCHLLPTKAAHKIIKEAMAIIRQFGWTIERHNMATFRWTIGGHRIEVKKTTDPRDGRTKIMAYIPASIFEGEAEYSSHKLQLPKSF